jgi:hypothetical protein
MERGTPQGNPLSCLFFNLYLEALLRYINADANSKGLTIGTDTPTNFTANVRRNAALARSITVKHLAYSTLIISLRMQST